MVLIILTLSGVIYDRNRVQGYANAKERNKNIYSNNTILSKVVVNAKGAVLIEQESGKILFEKSGNERMYPASTTKILTALVAIENGNLNEVITVGDEVRLIEPDGSRAWLRIGEKIKLSDLIMGLMLPSGNDAAYTIAINIGKIIGNNPSMNREDAIKIFINKMNERAREIGANNSNFINPNGFHDIEHYSTPYDLALIAKEAFKYEFFKQVVKTYTYKCINILLLYAHFKPIYTNFYTNTCKPLVLLNL
jgi:D-alanyl-D-alanine carboxypeptidase (penicillin-binding protein 5/6)